MCEIFDDFWCIFFIRVLIFDFGIFRLVSFLMECSCMAPLTPATMVIMGVDSLVAQVGWVVADFET